VRQWLEQHNVPIDDDFFIRWHEVVIVPVQTSPCL
jgi:hypothetical protein